jgi:hypothetical protein
LHEFDSQLVKKAIALCNHSKLSLTYGSYTTTTYMDSGAGGF